MDALVPSCARPQLLSSLNVMAQDSHPTTAWKAGQFVIDTARLVSRSDIVLGQPNTAPAEAMPTAMGAPALPSGRLMDSPRS